MSGGKYAGLPTRQYP